MVAPAPRNQKVLRMYRGTTQLLTPEAAVAQGGWVLGPNLSIGCQIGWTANQRQQIADCRQVRFLAARMRMDSSPPSQWADQQWGQRCRTLASTRLELFGTVGEKAPSGETKKRITGFRPEWLVWIEEVDYLAALEPYRLQGYVEEEYPFGDAPWYQNLVMGWRVSRPEYRTKLPVPDYQTGGTPGALRLWRIAYLLRLDDAACRKWVVRQAQESARAIAADALFVGNKDGEYQNPQSFVPAVWPHTLHAGAYAPGAFRVGINATIRELAGGEMPLPSLTQTIAGSGAQTLWGWVEPATDSSLIAEGRF